MHLPTTGFKIFSQNFIVITDNSNVNFDKSIFDTMKSRQIDELRSLLT